jgi:hypothetical protein
METKVNRLPIVDQRLIRFTFSMTDAGVDPQAIETVSVRTDSLVSGYSPRTLGIDSDHVKQLIETPRNWPPLLVQRSSMSVIDGSHRLVAARSLNLEHISVVFFDGSNEAARVEAIRRNNDHGLPLTAHDRQTAAADLLARHPNWSDGRVAEVCSISPKTVGQLRRRHPITDRRGCQTASEASRIGRDGKRYPVDSARLKTRIADAIFADPEASLRTIAARAQSSPETVRRVRQLEKVDSVPATQVGPLPTIDAEMVSRSRPRVRWSRDVAYSSTPGGARFANWFERHEIDESTLLDHSRAVPISRIYEVIDESRRRSLLWSTFAEILNEALQKRLRN